MKIVLSILTLAVFLTPLNPIFAQTATSPAAKREAIGQKIENRMDALEQKRGAVLDKMEERRLRIASKSAALKERLLKFRDKTKAQKVERVNENLEKINSKRTEMMTQHLNKLSEILGKLETRVEQAKTNGKDTSSTESAIADARSSIDAAKAAVDAQAANEYTITVSTEAAVKTDATDARNKLHTDLKAVHNLIVDARKAVGNAISTASSAAKEQSGQQ